MIIVPGGGVIFQTREVRKIYFWNNILIYPCIQENKENKVGRERDAKGGKAIQKQKRDQVKKEDKNKKEDEKWKLKEKEEERMKKFEEEMLKLEKENSRGVYFPKYNIFASHLFFLLQS